mmetsp:Transcript_19505/g.34787  ORF Transcript_19505/g.34787 Transcript_19505/m.34787 type:complete len:251 (+) Transcript_19505:698-1450(+)
MGRRACCGLQTRRACSAGVRSGTETGRCSLDKRWKAEQVVVVSPVGSGHCCCCCHYCCCCCLRRIWKPLHSKRRLHQPRPTAPLHGIYEQRKPIGPCSRSSPQRPPHLHPQFRWRAGRRTAVRRRGSRPRAPPPYRPAASRRARRAPRRGQEAALACLDRRKQRPAALGCHDRPQTWQSSRLHSHRRVQLAGREACHSGAAGKAQRRHAGLTTASAPSNRPRLCCFTSASAAGRASQSRLARARVVPLDQ